MGTRIAAVAKPQQRAGHGKPSGQSARLVQRKCACGGAAAKEGGCEKCQRKPLPALQTKLAVGEQSDGFETEADRVAERVMRMPEQVTTGHTPQLQRQAVTPVTSSDAGVAEAPPVVEEVLSAPGQPLDVATRKFMEARFGHDFSQVRVHTDSRADESARAVGALAYTVGRNVIFAAGRYAPETSDGRRLLAHELTHVLQQGAGGRELTTQAPSPVQRQVNHQVLQRQAQAPRKKLVILSLAEIKADSDREKRRVNTGQTEAKVCQSTGKAPDDTNCPDKLKPGAEVTFVAEPVKDRWYQIENTGGFRQFGPKQPVYIHAAFAKEQPASGAANTPTTTAAPPKATPAVAKGPAAGKQAEAADLAVAQIDKGEFVTVLNSLNGMPMEYMLKRVQKLQTAQLEMLNYHVFDSKGLGEKSGWRIASALGAVHMSRLGVNAVKVNALEDAMTKADLPEDQRVLIRAIVPPLPGGAATRVDQHFGITKIPAAGSQGAAMVETWSAAQALGTLNGMSDKDLKDALAQIDKSQLQALMMNSRQAEQYGELKVERLRQALYVAWSTRFPAERAKFDVGGDDASWVAKLSVGAKISEAMLRSIGKLPGQGWERVKELITPESIAMMSAFAIAYIVSQTTPIGWLADILIAGIIAATVIMLGKEVIEIVQLLIKFADKASGAQTSHELDEAAELFATAVSKVGIDIIVAILFHKAGKAANLKPPSPRSPGIVDLYQKGGLKALQEGGAEGFKGGIEAFKKGGGRVMADLFPQGEFATNAVTANGAGPVAFESVPGLKLMMEAKGAGVEPPKGGGGSGKGVAADAAAGGEPGAGAKPATPPRSQKLSAGAGLKKPKVRSPADPVVVEEAPKSGDKPAAADKPAADKPAAAEKTPADVPGKGARAEARASAKAEALSKLEEAKALERQIINEIIENREQAKGKTGPERAALDAEWKSSQNERNNATAEVNKLQGEFSKLDLTPYDKARAYSMSDAAWTDTVTRAKGLDEISGKKPDAVSVDHTVPVREITEMEGYNELHPDDWKQVLSNRENLKAMDSDLNSSKGGKRWADWDAGRRHYGEQIWKSMVEFENQMRGKLQAQIKALAKARRQ